MPTAVERLANFLTDALKLDAIDGAQTQQTLTTADGTLDSGLAALTSATTRSAFVAADRQYGRDFYEVGASAFGVGADLQRDALVFYDVDQYLGGGSLRSATGTQAAFAAFDKALSAAGGAMENFGADFAALGQVGSSSALTALEKRLESDAKTVAADFATLGSDTSALLADIAPATTTTPTSSLASTTTSSSPYAGLATAAASLPAEFGTIGADYTSLANAFGGGGGSGGPSLAAVVSSTTTSSPLAAAFGALDTSLLGLDTSLQGLATPLANVLLPSTTTPTTNNTL